MPGASPHAILAELASAVAESRPERAVALAAEALNARVSHGDIAHACAVGGAPRYNVVQARAPHGLTALAAAANAAPFLAPGDAALAMLQSVFLIASVTKLPEPAPSPHVMAGEVTHLARSALFAARAGDLDEAEALFLGITEDGWERRMAGDALFRAALEDLGESGHKLTVAVTDWELCRLAGFRDARTILRPAVQYLVKGPRDPGPFQSMMAVLGRGWVDLDALAAGRRPLDEAGRGALSIAVAAPSDQACVEGVLALLRQGLEPASVVHGLVVEAARRALATEGYDLGAIHALEYAHAARTVVTFSQTSERVYAVFQAALRIRSAAPHLPSVSVPEPADEAAGLRQVAGDLEARRPREVAARIRAYLSRGFSGPRLLALLGRSACVDSSVANQGHNLTLLEACASEFRAAPEPEIAMALGKLVAASPRDTAGSKEWASRLVL